MNLHKHPSYSTWASMIQRCTNPKRDSWRYYGGKGITVCQKWLKFEGFLEDMGEKPVGYSIDRIDPSKGYFKANCCWRPKGEESKTTERFLSIGVCIDCGENRGNRKGRCHRCNEYFRRRGSPRPQVIKHSIICSVCRQESWRSVKGMCRKCYHADWIHSHGRAAREKGLLKRAL